jgi:RNase P subunit RPR2
MKKKDSIEKARQYVEKAKKILEKMVNFMRLPKHIKIINV